jgi:hypothetical protein
MMARFDLEEAAMSITEQWQSETPGHHGWATTARPDDPNEFFIVSADCRAIDPRDLEPGKGWA